MEIQVGEYVRTKDGIIAKLVKINELEQYKFDNIVDTVEFSDVLIPCELSCILNHSFEPIDLVKIDDYVNGLKINCILEVGKEKILRCVFPYREDSTEYKDLKEKGLEYCQPLHLRKDDIKSIVTKEQFESMSYKVV